MNQPPKFQVSGQTYPGLETSEQYDPYVQLPCYQNSGGPISTQSLLAAKDADDIVENDSRLHWIPTSGKWAARGTCPGESP